MAIDPDTAEGPIRQRGDAQTFALSRAATLGVFTSTPTIFEDDFVKLPANAAGPSPWQSVSLTGTGTLATLLTAKGGVVRQASGASAGGISSMRLGGVTTVGQIAEPGAAGSRWYLLWIFRIPTTPDAQTTINLKFQATAGFTNVIFFGVDGQFASTTKLMAEESILNVTLSDTDIAPNTWHYLEAYQLGAANAIKFRFDGEAEKTLTLTGNLGGPGYLSAQAGNGTTAATQQVDHDHVVLLMDNNIVLPGV